MPIDALNQTGTTPASSVERAAPGQGASKPVRQELPSDGQTLPPAGVQPVSGRAEVEQAVDRLNDYVQLIRRDLQFSVDDETGETIVKVVDSESGELIRQIPSEQALAISKAIASHLEQTQGIILQELA